MVSVLQRCRLVKLERRWSVLQQQKVGPDHASANAESVLKSDSHRQQKEFSRNSELSE